MTKSSAYDVAIIGAGPAGLAASVYASRYKLRNAVFGHELGGYVSTTHLVEDYLGYQSVTGLNLANDFVEHAKKFGADIVPEKVTAVRRKESEFKLKTWSDKEFTAKAILIATGTVHNKLGVPGEDKFEGRGVSYCVTCDAAFFKGKPVAIVGGGDSALKGALHLTEFASHVYVIHRRDEFRAEPIWVERVKERSNVTFLVENTVKEVLGGDKVSGVKLAKPFKGKTELSVDGVFVEIGSTPDRSVPDMVGAKVDKHQNLIVNAQQRTTAERVWGAGDNTTGSAIFRQIGTAVGEGSIAAGDVYEYLSEGRSQWLDKNAEHALVTD